MDFIIAAIYGIIQGITEFLPISSSGHLVLLHQYLPLNPGNEPAFDVLLHLATVLAVILYFRRDIADMAMGVFGPDKKKARLGWLIILSAIPAGLLGFLFADAIEALFRSAFSVAMMLILAGAVFIIAERLGRQTKKLEEVGARSAFLVGLAQAIALVPGTSRSGITIAAGLFLGLERAAAIRFSFLMSIPVILGANLFKLPDLFTTSITLPESGLYILAFISAYISGFFAIKYFIALAGKLSLEKFAYYRFALALLILLILFF